jgi:hypothetical protein
MCEPPNTSPPYARPPFGRHRCRAKNNPAWLESVLPVAVPWSWMSNVRPDPVFLFSFFKSGAWVRPVKCLVMLLKKLCRWTGLLVMSIAMLIIASFLLLWAKYRIPTGPAIEYTTQVRYQMLDLGQAEPAKIRYWVIEPLTGHSRLFLVAGPLLFVYASDRQVQECWPEHWRVMREKGYTIEVTYRTRKLLFAEGVAPADLIQIRRATGSPYVTK